jgi:transposase InsO family protein
MPWERRPIMSQRLEFVRHYEQSGNMTAACEQAGISRPTGYKWWERYQEHGLEGLKDRSKEPHSSPNKTPDAMEEVVLEIRENHGWGGRKIERRLNDLGYEDVPVPSTITAILHRHGEIDEAESEKRGPYQRFEADAPNDRWQMDFKGYFAIEGGQCHPLTVLDDCSRFSIGLKACPNERRTTVQTHLKTLFHQYGCPDEMLMDNGQPWGHDSEHRHTSLTVWLMELGIRIRHSRPYHPETMGKDERFHRTFKEAIQSECEGRLIADCQPLFDDWRHTYNAKRPHEALDLDVPAKHYESSDRSMPETIREWNYTNCEATRKVHANGVISYENRLYLIGMGFAGKYVGLKETDTDKQMSIRFREFDVKRLDLESDQINN